MHHTSANTERVQSSSQSRSTSVKLEYIFGRILFKEEGRTSIISIATSVFMAGHLLKQQLCPNGNTVLSIGYQVDINCVVIVVI